MSIVYVRDAGYPRREHSAADIFSRDRERVACGRLDNPVLEHTRFQSEASHVCRTCELAISFEGCALLRTRKTRDDVNDARAAIA